MSMFTLHRRCHDEIQKSPSQQPQPGVPHGVFHKPGEAGEQPGLPGCDHHLCKCSFLFGSLITGTGGHSGTLDWLREGAFGRPVIFLLCPFPAEEQQPSVVLCHENQVCLSAYLTHPVTSPGSPTESCWCLFSDVVWGHGGAWEWDRTGFVLCG